MDEWDRIVVVEPVEQRLHRVLGIGVAALPDVDGLIDQVACIDDRAIGQDD